MVEFGLRITNNITLQCNITVDNITVLPNSDGNFKQLLEQNR